MIADAREYKITSYGGKPFRQAIDEFDNSPWEGISPRLFQAERESLESNCRL